MVHRVIGALDVQNDVHIEGGFEFSFDSEHQSLGEVLTTPMAPTKKSQGLFSEAELVELEAEHREGMTAVQIVEIFSARGVRLSEATFRKYVQQGLLPRSRRVGRKGKHRGSLGLYPVKALSRINVIKTRMAEGYTIEEIQSRFLRHVDAIESVEEGVADFLDGVSEDLETLELSKKERKSVERQLDVAERLAEDLLRTIQELSQRVLRGAGEGYRSQGAAGSAEELL